ncbi:hypothetical protein M9Y10_002994 [Tritrichomonas musculus]|uniref:Uncharacterized protein n=1 Tax=Tritrichomonas musculus TaxID=1915356 RepID=A0ABR2LBF8_9EUKA
MLISLLILFSYSKSNHFCVLKSIKSNKQSEFAITSKICIDDENIIDYVDFQKFIKSTQLDRINFTVYGFDRNFPLVIDVSNTTIKFFDINGGTKNQFIYFYNTNEDTNIKATKVSILFDQTKIHINSIILSRSIIYSPNGKIDFFTNYLTTDGFSLKNNFFSNIVCIQYKLTSRVKPTAKIYVLQNEYKNILPEKTNFEVSDNNIESYKTENSNRNKFNSSLPSNFYSKIIKSLHSKQKLQNQNILTINNSRPLEDENSFFHRYIVNDEFAEYPQYFSNQIKYIKNDETEGSEDEVFNSTDVKYCLCMKSRLIRCIEHLECDSFYIPIENYVTGKEPWFKSDISHSINRTIRLYVTGTEGMTMNIGFDDFRGRNNTIIFNPANPNSPVYLSITGKYMSSSLSQRAVFSLIFNNINRVSIDPDMVQNLNDVMLRQSPLFIRPSHHLTLHRLITDTRSIESFEGTLYMTEFLVLNNSYPLQLDGTLFLDEGCFIYVPQVSLFPNIFINDEYIIFSDEDQDNDLVLYFSELSENPKNWTFYMSNEISVEAGQTLSSINISLKTNSESTIPLLFIFDIQYQDISLFFDDISKLSESMHFEVVTSESASVRSTLEIQIDYTEQPKNMLFKRITGNIDLVLLTAKTIQYFLDNSNPAYCFEGDTSERNSSDCQGINLYGLHSLTFYVYNSMTRCKFENDSISIFFGTDFISFSAVLTNTIQVIAEVEKPLMMSIDQNLTHIFPLNLIVINNNSVIEFDESFVFIVNNEDSQISHDVAKNVAIYHEALNIDLVSSSVSQIPLLSVDDPVNGVLYNTSSEIEYRIDRSTNFSLNSYRSGPKVIVNIIDENIVVPQSSFLSNEVEFIGRPFIFGFRQKSRSTYIIKNEVKFHINQSSHSGFVKGMSINSLNNYSVTSQFLQDANLYDSNELVLNDRYSDILLDENEESSSLKKVYIAEMKGLILTKSGTFSQNNDQLLSPNIKFTLLVDSLKAENISSIDVSNFEGPIIVFSDFHLDDEEITEILFSNDSIRVVGAFKKSAYLLQALPKATFEIIYDTGSSRSKSKILLDDQVTANHIIYLRVVDKKTEILKNVSLTINSPVTLFFDSTWYNVTNPEDLVINANKDVKIQTELIKMPNFTVNLYKSAVETVVIEKPKHTSTIAFYTFLALAVAVFIVCITFCIIDFCCIIKPKSVEIDLDSSSSDRSSENFPFSSISSLYEYYSDDEYYDDENSIQEKEIENENDQNANNNLNNNSDDTKKMSITAYGNTTAEWRAEFLKKRRRRTYTNGEDVYRDDDESDDSDRNDFVAQNDEYDADNKRKKKKKRQKKKKQNDIDYNQNQNNEVAPFEEIYYDDDDNDNY